MSNITGDDGSLSSGNTGEEVLQQDDQKKQLIHASTNTNGSTSMAQQQQQQPAVKKKRNLPGTPDPSAEVIALSPTTLMATNRFVCEICSKGFQRDQNLQLHRRGHNLPWKLRQRTSTEVRKRVYICPETSCVHHNPARALGDLTGIKKHFSRKHGEKKWKCDKCSKKYAVQSDWKAHQKTCGTREYKCDCGTIFSRRDSFITHRAFCDALAEENNKVNQGMNNNNNMGSMSLQQQAQIPSDLISSMPLNTNTISSDQFNSFDLKNPLKSIPQELVPMPFNKPNTIMNMAAASGGMFSTSSGTLFGSPRSISSPNSSSTLQLSSSNSSSSPGFNYLTQQQQQQLDTKNGISAAAAHMSATALLQKAAQMGATASNSINSPMMQKSYVTTSMAGSHQDHQQQLSGGPVLTRQTSYGAMQLHHNNNTSSSSSYDHQSPNMIGINGGGGPTMMSSQLFDNGTGAMNDIGMLNGLLMNGGINDHFTQNHELVLKNMEHEDSTSSSHVKPGTTTTMERSPLGRSRFGGSGSGDMMTLDFLGIGGSRNVNLHEQQQHQYQQQQQQQQQRLELEAISQQRMKVMNPFQQQLSHGDSAMEKPIWDA